MRCRTPPGSLLPARCQVEWALRTKCRVDRKFYRAAAAFRAVSHRSNHRQHSGTITIIVVPEVKRLKVMRNEDALDSRLSGDRRFIAAIRRPGVSRRSCEEHLCW